MRVRLRSNPSSIVLHVDGDYDMMILLILVLATAALRALNRNIGHAQDARLERCVRIADTR